MEDFLLDFARISGQLCNGFVGRSLREGVVDGLVSGFCTKCTH